MKFYIHFAYEFQIKDDFYLLIHVIVCILFLSFCFAFHLLQSAGKNNNGEYNTLKSTNNTFP